MGGAPRGPRSHARRRWGVVIVALVVLVEWTTTFLSRSRCETRTRQSIESVVAHTQLPIEWSPVSRLEEEPFPKHWLGSTEYERSKSLFRPTLTYRDPAAGWMLPGERPAEAHGFARARVPIPGIARVHFGYEWSAPRNLGGRGNEARWVRSGLVSQGVDTYLCLFGVVVQLDRWEVGGQIH